MTNITQAANDQKLVEHVSILESQLVYTLKNHKPAMAALVRIGEHREAAVAGKAIEHVLQILRASNGELFGS